MKTIPSRSALTLIELKGKWTKHQVVMGPSEVVGDFTGLPASMGS
jgi:hypothetical protein